MEWRVVPGFYHCEISEYGDVRLSAAHANCGIKPPETRSGVDGYVAIKMYYEDGKSFQIGAHRLVAIVFHGPPPFPKAKALHWDDVPTNNHYSNIRWGSSADNFHDMVRNIAANKRQPALPQQPEPVPLSADPEFATIEVAKRVACCGRSRLYQMLEPRGPFRTKKDGRNTLISLADIRAYQRSLPEGVGYFNGVKARVSALPGPQAQPVAAE